MLTAAITGEDSDTLRVSVINPASSTVTFSASDPYGGQVSRTVTITGRGGVTRSVPENSAAGTAVGDPVTGTPHGTETLSYTLTGDAADAFTIDSASGQISVKQGATLDYETENSYTGQVNWTVQGQAAAADLTINISDVGAGKPDTPVLTRTAFSEPSDPALDVTWTAAAANGLTITGYKAQYRKKADQNEQPAAWTDYTVDDGNGNQTKTLPASTLSINLAGLETGATYEVQVRAVTSEESEGPWSEAGEGTANTPPAANGADIADSTIAVGSSANHDISGKFSDADGDTLSYSASSAYPGVLTAAITGDDSDTLTVTVVSPALATVTYSAVDPYGGQFSRTVTITGKMGVTRSVPENSAAGTAVGDPVTGTPYNSETLTYTLTGDAADAFTIDLASGQISVKQGATLDYETENSYTGQVNWTVQGQAAAAGLTINVSDVGTGKPGAPTLTRTAFSEPSDPALDVAWNAVVVDGATVTGYKAQYRKKAAAGETPAAWTAYTGTLSVTDTSLTLPDLEAGAIYEAQVRAVTSEEGEGPWSDIGEGRSNRPPSAIDIPDQTGAANTQGSLRAGDYFDDPDSDSLKFAVSTEHPSLIQAVEELRDTVTWRYLDVGQSEVTVVAHDGYGGSVSKSFAATITPQARVLAPPRPLPPPPPPSPEPTSINLSVSPASLNESDGETEVVVTATFAQSGTLDEDCHSCNRPCRNGNGPGGLHCRCVGRRDDTGGKPERFRHPHPDPGGRRGRGGGRDDRGFRNRAGFHREFRNDYADRCRPRSGFNRGAGRTCARGFPGIAAGQPFRARGRHGHRGVVHRRIGFCVRERGSRTVSTPTRDCEVARTRTRTRAQLRHGHVPARSDTDVHHDNHPGRSGARGNGELFGGPG